MTPRIRRVSIVAPRRLDYLVYYSGEFFDRERLGNTSGRSPRSRDSAHVCFLQASEDDHGRARWTNIHRFENRQSMHTGIEIDDDGGDVFQSTLDTAEGITAGLRPNDLVAGPGRG